MQMWFVRCPTRFADAVLNALCGSLATVSFGGSGLNNSGKGGTSLSARPSSSGEGASYVSRNELAEQPAFKLRGASPV
ncbi:hypothetical protein SKAU_G00347200 [Synaphobranchus kaupii]|uniref:Secreted protein n=1 Tax=Synaphobranchus kaupii TaxID=118154 RepID=A0A9Q1EJS3_SYNKA|nr:hypothetical protein SKAU_G00347200 [Synaphobranchus kaupii]